MKKAKFEIFNGLAADRVMWYFHLRSPNGRIVLQSEGYTSRRVALKGIRAIKKYADAEIVVR